MARTRLKPTFPQLAEQYVHHLMDARRSPATIRWHEYHLSRFWTWAEPRVASMHPQDWCRHQNDKSVFQRYLAEAGRNPTVKGTTRSAASLKSMRSSLRSFTRWLQLSGRLEVDLLLGHPQPKLPERLKPRLAPDQVRLLLKAAAASRNPRRDSALIRFMLDTGCRAGEISSLQAADIDWRERRASVLGKGNKQRFVFFTADVADALRRYDAEERNAANPHFFQTETGRSLTPAALLNLCKRLTLQTGIHVHPHLFRHTFAITYLNAGGDVFALQKRLGHATLAMSEHYAKHATDDLAREHDDHSPHDYFFRNK